MEATEISPHPLALGASRGSAESSKSGSKPTDVMNDAKFFAAMGM